MKNVLIPEFRRASDGSVGVEYALLASLISILIATAAAEIGEDLVGFFDAVVRAFQLS